MSTPLQNHDAQPDELDLEALWLPFTANRAFKRKPRLFSSAEGMYYVTPDGRRVLDGVSGLWCSNVGHRHPHIVAAVKQQLDVLDYAIGFQAHHPGAFELASRLAAIAPPQLNHVFFTNSGSEACDTALKIALAYHKANGEGGRFRFIGREKGYHGVGFGGISVGGMTANRSAFASALLPGVDHLPHTLNADKMAYSRGQPAWGAHLADELERLVALHDAATIAAVIVEPMQGSAGVVVPPISYLERLREICTKHGILLIFDEVITGFGRLGNWFSYDRFGVEPDLMTFAKGVTSGVVPMGGVYASDDIFNTIMSGPEELIEFFHGYTYSGHPLACAAGIAALDVYTNDQLFESAPALEHCLEQGVHLLDDHPLVTDVRNLGLAAAIDLMPRSGHAGARGRAVFDYCFEHGVLVRFSADTIALGPALIATPGEIEHLLGILSDAINALD